MKKLYPWVVILLILLFVGFCVNGIGERKKELKQSARTWLILVTTPEGKQLTPKEVRSVRQPKNHSSWGGNQHIVDPDTRTSWEWEPIIVPSGWYCEIKEK